MSHDHISCSTFKQRVLTSFEGIIEQENLNSLGVSDSWYYKHWIWIVRINKLSPRVFPIFDKSEASFGPELSIWDQFHSSFEPGFEPEFNKTVLFYVLFVAELKVRFTNMRRTDYNFIYPNISLLSGHVRYFISLLEPYLIILRSLYCHKWCIRKSQSKSM